MSLSITEIRDVVATNESHTEFDMEINHPNYGWIPYTLNPSDTDQTVNNPELRSLIGNNFAPYAAPTQVEEDGRAEIIARTDRNSYLEHEVDPIAGNTLRWNALTDAQRAAWTQYRTDLLNVPQQAGFPNNINWPVKPT